MSPTPASAPRPGGGVRGHTTRVGIAVTAAAAVAVAALPSDRPCPATGRPRQGLRRSRAVAHTPATAQQRAPTPRANPGPQAAYEHEPNPAPRAFIPSPAQSTSPPVPVASVPRRVPRRQMSARSLQRPAHPPDSRRAPWRHAAALGHPSLIDNSGTWAPPPQPPRRSPPTPRVPPTRRAGRARRRPTAAACTSTERTSSAKRGCDSPTSSSTRRQNPPRPHTCGASTDLVRPSLSVPTCRWPPALAQPPPLPPSQFLSNIKRLNDHAQPRSKPRRPGGLAAAGAQWPRPACSFGCEAAWRAAAHIAQRSPAKLTLSFPLQDARRHVGASAGNLRPRQPGPFCGVQGTCPTQEHPPLRPTQLTDHRLGFARRICSPSTA